MIGTELDADATAAALSANLRRLREVRGLTRRGLALLAGVGSSTVSEVERALRPPSINIVARLARALGVEPFALLHGRPSSAVVRRSHGAASWTSADGRVAITARFPPDRELRARLYQLRLDPGARHEVGPRPRGTTCHAIACAGRLYVELADEVHLLGADDAIMFRGDRPHAYATAGPTAALVYALVRGEPSLGDLVADWPAAQSST